MCTVYVSINLECGFFKRFFFFFNSIFVFYVIMFHSPFLVRSYGAIPYTTTYNRVKCQKRE